MTKKLLNRLFLKWQVKPALNPGFSEDIDLNIDTQSKPTEGQRKKLKENIVSIIDGLGFTLDNADNVRSRRNYNRYIVDYWKLLIKN